MTATDDDLLLAILAFQAGRLDRRAMIEAILDGVRDRATSIGDLLVRRGAIRAAELEALRALLAGVAAGTASNGRAEMAAAETVAGSNRYEVAALPGVAETVGLNETGGDPYATRAASPTVQAIAPLRFGRLRPFAKGGLGELFVALDRELDREVLVKEIQDRHADDPESRGRFVAEAKITGRLEHPGIVPVYGFGRYDDGRPYYAMRLIRGETLKDAIDRFHADRERLGRSSDVAFRGLLRRFFDLCDTVAYAHSRGVVHRDLKPANVMLGRYGETVLLDWGLAKPVELINQPDEDGTGDRPILPGSVGSSSQTMMGSALGTPAYMSPEQATGRLELMGPATDVYSLGATLFHLLTGRAPFTDADGDLGSVLQKVERGDFPRPRQLAPWVPKPLESICLKAMAPAPGDRYGSARALAEDLERWNAGEPVSSHVETGPERLGRWSRHHRTTVRIGLTALVALTIVSMSATGLIESARREESVARRRSDALSAGLALDHGLELITHGDAGRGLLRIGQSLLLTPPEAVDQRRAILENIAAWQSELAPLLGVIDHGGPIRALVLGPGGRTVLTGGYEAGAADDDGPIGLARLWDATAGGSVGPPLRQDAPIVAVAIGPDGKLGLTASEAGEAILWDVHTGTPKRSPIRHGDALTAAALSPDGSRAATAGPDGLVRVWETASGAEAGPARDHGSPVLSLAFAPDGRLISGDRDGAIRIGRPGEEAPPHPTIRHPGGVLSLAVRPDGGALAVGGDDGTTRVWDLTSGTLLFDPLRAHLSVYSLAFSSDGALLATGGEDNNARVWHADTGRQIAEAIEHAGSVFAMAFRPGEDVLVTGSGSGRARTWGLLAAAERPTLRIGEALSGLAFSPDGRLVAAAPSDGPVQLIDAATGRPHPTTLDHGGPVAALVFLRGGQRLATIGGDGTIRTWVTATGAAIEPDLDHGDAALAAALHPDGRLLVGDGTGRVRLWDLEDRQPSGPSINHGDPISAVAVAPDGGRAVVAGGPTARLWDLEARRPIGAPLQHDGAIYAAAFSPDGKLVVTGGDDNVARFWDAATGKPTATPLLHPGSVMSVAFSSDGHFVATGGADEAVRIWDVETGRPVGPRLEIEGRVAALAFHPDGRSIVAGGRGGMLRFWALPPALPDDPERVVAWLKVLTGYDCGADARFNEVPRPLDRPRWLAVRERLRRLGGPPIP